jgi:subtilisin family serine protease
MAGRSTSGAGLAIRAGAAVAALALTLTLSSTAAPADSGALRESEWALDYLKADRAWEVSRGQGVTVAVIGTGVDASHPDLKGRVIKGADLADYATGDGTRDQGEAEVQGTHAAGIIAGTGRNFGGDGLYGLAPDARVLPIRVFRDKAPVVAATASGIRHAAREGAQVINVTVSFSEPSEELRTAVEYASQSNALVVAGAGDNGKSGSAATYPAAYPGVVSVSAIDKKSKIWPDSHQGRDVILAAPGVDILTTDRSGEYWTGSGTGLAASWVAASAALVRAEHPRWNVARVIENLTDSASGHNYPTRNDRIGLGIVAPASALGDSSGAAASARELSNDRTGDAQGPSSDAGPALIVLAVTTTLLVLAVIAWLLIRRSVTPSDND